MEVCNLGCSPEICDRYLIPHLVPLKMLVAFLTWTILMRYLAFATRNAIRFIILDL